MLNLFFSPSRDSSLKIHFAIFTFVKIKTGLIMNQNLLKKLSLFLLFFLSASALFAFEDGHYRIKVKINGVKDSACYLANYYGDKQYLKDTAMADKNGNLVFEGKPA